MVAVTVGFVYRAILVKVGIGSLDRLTVTVVQLLVHIEHVRSIALGEHLNLVLVLNRRTYNHICLAVALHQ